MEPLGSCSVFRYLQLLKVFLYMFYTYVLYVLNNLNKTFSDWRIDWCNVRLVWFRRRVLAVTELYRSRFNRFISESGAKRFRKQGSSMYKNLYVRLSPVFTIFIHRYWFSHLPKCLTKDKWKLLPAIEHRWRRKHRFKLLYQYQQVIIPLPISPGVYHITWSIWYSSYHYDIRAHIV